MIIYIISGVIAILIVLAMMIIIKINKINDLKENLKISQKDISTLLNKKYNILNSVTKFLSKNFEIELETIEKNNLEEEYNIELDKNLSLLVKKFYDLVEENDKLKKEKKITLFKTNLKDIDENIYGLKSYYNDNSEKINNLFSKPLYKILLTITKTSKYKKFDTKKEAELEILKD